MTDRIKHQFILILPYGRHWNTLTMLHGKLERGPEEVVPREVVQSAPPSKYLYWKDKLIDILFYFSYLQNSVYGFQFK